MEEIAYSHPPRLVYGSGSTRHGYIIEVACPLKVLKVTDHNLSTPYPAIHPISCPVHGQSYNGLPYTVFCHAANNVGMVVLDADQFKALLL